MTLEEEKNIIGGVVVEYDQVKKRLAALRARCSSIGHTCRSLEVILTMPDPRFESLELQLTNLPSHDEIRRIANEVQSNLSRRAELEQIMSDYGLDVLSAK